VRVVAVLVLSMAASVAVPAATAAQSASAGLPGPPAIVATHPAIQSSLSRIAAGSLSWRADLDAIRTGGRQVLVVTPDELAALAPASGPSSLKIGKDLLAEVIPVADANFSVARVIAVVNLPLIESLHQRRNSLPAEVEADLDVIIVHEVYGHAFPYLIAGDESGRCLDPTVGQRAAEACSIRRENIVRFELKLGRRTDYGVAGLLFVRR
jgi:hypothetical protein